jgi:hypothetical protein
MTRLADWFVQAGAILGRPVEPNFMLLLSDGRKLNSVVRVLDVGAKNGMLVFEDYEFIRKDLAEFAALEYGFSIMDESSSDEEFDFESFKEVFADWAGGATLA